MKNLKLIFACNTLILVLSSCGTKLKKDETKYIPYNGNEILVFQSNHNELDTIFLTGISKFNACYDPLSLFKTTCDGKELLCKRSDPNYDRYFTEFSLVSISKIKGGTSISFDIKLRHSWFYGKDYMDIEHFKNLPNSEMKIGNVFFNDVKIIEADHSYIERADYVERFYWSVSHGFLGLDQRNRNWRLVKIIN
uniref:hypothetical protein n=1 Tax=Flavobacterium sp. TaxID=239 RepID=UPI00404AF415